MPWTTCDVIKAGPAENGIIYVQLRSTDNSFNNWFEAVPQMEREMLATALTAISTSKRVNAFLTATTPYSTINRLYVVS